MHVKSKIKRSIAWCWKHGKSFYLTDIGIINCSKLGADINLQACGCIEENMANAMAKETVYYYYWKKDGLKK